MYNNLQKIGKDYRWLKKELEKFKIKPEEALVVTYNRTEKNILSSKGKEKMREIIIIILILLIILLGGFLIQKYLYESSNKLAEQLENIKPLLDENTNIDELKKKCNDFYEDWQKTEKKWSVIVVHNELDLIETALIEAKVNIEEEDLDEGKVEIEKSIFLISHISEKEKLSLKNIL